MFRTPLAQRTDYLLSLKPIVYQAGESEVSFTDFLDTYKPSETRSEDGIGWIAVRMRRIIEENESPEQPESDIEGLLKKWDELMVAKTEVTAKLMKALAIDYNVKTGFWLIIVPTGPKADILWRKVTTGVVENNLNGCSYSATIGAIVPNVYNQAICIYNADATNDQEVFALEKAIRTVGIKCTMKYKPNVYGYCGIYCDTYTYKKYRLHKNMRPTILISNFDVIKRESRLITHEGRVVCVNRISE